MHLLQLTALQAGSSQHGSPEALKLLSQLAAFSSHPYHHGDPDPIKAITAAADRLAAACPSDSPGWQQCMQALLELLFMHSSRPLHRHLLSFVRKLGQAHQDVVGQVLVGSVSREAAAVLLAGSHSQQQQEWVPLQQAGVSPAVAAAVLAAPPRLPAVAVSRGFDLAQAAISLLQMPAARAWLQPAGPLLLLAIARSIQTTMDPQQQQPTATAAGKQVQPRQPQQPQQHLTAKTIELVQDAINVMYMVLQYHGQHIAAAAAVDGPTAGTSTASAAGAAAAGEQGALALASICEAAQSMLCTLQGSLVVREALASAAVVVWSAAILPAVPPTAASLVVAAGLTPEQLPPGLAAAAAAVAGAHGVCARSGSISARAQQLLQAWRDSSLLEQQLALQGRSLVAELQAAPHVARVCALRGLLAAMPAAALAGDLGMSPRPATDSSGKQAAARSGSDTGCSFIMQCALPFALEAARDAPDAHVKFFAMSLLASVLEGAAQLWGGLEEQQLQLAATDASLLGDATGAVGPDVAPAGGQGGGSGGDRADVLIVPWLSSTDAQAVMALLSSHMDEPVAQVLAKVQESFEALLSLIKVQHDSAEKLRLQPPRSGGNTATAAAPTSSAGAAASDATRDSTGAAGGTAELGAPMLDADTFLHDTAQSVLALGATRKGRYQPLTALLPHMGAQALLQLQPGLVAETIDAMQTNTCASAAAGFFRALLLQLRKELPAGNTGSSTPAAAGAGADALLQHVPAAMQAWCSCWLPEVLSALWEQGERARTYVANYALPMVLQAEPLLLQPMVDTILAAHAADAGAAGAQAAAAGGVDTRRVQQGTGARDAAATLAVVLRAARRLQLVGDLDILLPHQQQPEEGSAGVDDSSIAVSPAELLLSAVSSATASLRIEALELVCVSAR